MTGRILVLALLLVTATLLTTVVSPVLAIGAVRPDIVLLTVVGVGLADGAGTGARYGFSAGLLGDLLSSQSHLVGLGAFVLLLMGYLAGLARRYVSPGSVLGGLAVAAVVTLLSVVLNALLGIVLDLASPAMALVLRQALGTAAYHAVFALIVVRPVGALTRRLADAGVTGEAGAGRTRT